jgi:hypothetical protein
MIPLAGRRGLVLSVSQVFSRVVRGLLPVKIDFALNLLIEVRNEQRLCRPRIHIPAPSYGTRRHGLGGCNSPQSL